MITAPAAGSYQFRVVTNGAVRLWLDDHILVDTSCDTPLKPDPSHLMDEWLTLPPNQPTVQPAEALEEQPRDGSQRLGSLAGNCKEWDVPAEHATVTLNARDNVTHRIEEGLPLRLEWLHYGGADALLTVLWRDGTPSSRLDTGSAFTSIPSSALSASIPLPEQWRQDLQVWSLFVLPL